MARKIYYVDFNIGGASPIPPGTMRAYDIDGDSFEDVGDEPIASGIIDNVNGVWMNPPQDEGENVLKYYHDAAIVRYKGRLTSIIHNRDNNTVHLVQFDPNAGTNGVWSTVASGTNADTDNHRKAAAQLTVFNDQVFIGMWTNFSPSSSHVDNNFIWSWGGSGTVLTDRLINYVLIRDEVDNTHNAQMIKYSDLLYMSTTHDDADGAPFDSQISTFNPKDNVRASGIIDLEPISTASGDPADDGTYEITRVPGTDRLIFLTEDSDGAEGRASVFTYNPVASSGQNILGARFHRAGEDDTDWLMGNRSEQNNPLLVTIENPSGNYDDNRSGTYVFVPQVMDAGNAKHTEFLKYEKSAVSGAFEPAQMDVVQIDTDFGFTDADNMVNTRFNITSDFDKLYMVIGNSSASGIGPVVQKLYEFDPTASGDALYGLDYDKGVAPFPSGTWTYLTDWDTDDDEIFPQDMMVLDFQSSVDVIVPASGITRNIGDSFAIVNYTLYNDFNKFCDIIPLYSTDLGTNWNTATQVVGSGDGLFSLNATPSGSAYQFYWDVQTDFSISTNGLLFRIVTVPPSGT